MVNWVCNECGHVGNAEEFKGIGGCECPKCQCVDCSPDTAESTTREIEKALRQCNEGAITYSEFCNFAFARLTEHFGIEEVEKPETWVTCSRCKRVVDVNDANEQGEGEDTICKDCWRALTTK